MKRKQLIYAPLASVILGGAIASGVAMAQTIDTNTALSKHNSYRSIHNTPNMSLDNSLNSTAQRWAEHLAATGQLQHSPSSERNGAGENLYASYTTASSIPGNELAEQAVTSWYDEVSDYNYSNPGFSANTGHFTQVVWKSSTQLGCGAAQGTASIGGTQYNAFYVVCHYAPAGNVQGQFPQNVLQP